MYSQPGRIQENIPGELFMYWFRARRYIEHTLEVIVIAIVTIVAVIILNANTNNTNIIINKISHHHHHHARSRLILCVPPFLLEFILYNAFWRV